VIFQRVPDAVPDVFHAVSFYVSMFKIDKNIFMNMSTFFLQIISCCVNI